MIINTETVTGLGVTIRQDFEEGAGAALENLRWPSVSTTVPTGGRITEFPFNDDNRRIKRWDSGPRQGDERRQEKHQILTSRWEGTARLNKLDIEFDNLGVFSQDSRDFGDETMTFFEEMIFGMLFEPFEVTTPIHNGFDGVSFFNTVHPNGGNAQSNIQGSEVAVEPMWILMNTRRLRSIIMTAHTQFQLTQLFSPSDVFFTDEFVWGVRALLGFGYGKWWSAIASRETLNSDNFNSAVDQAAVWENSKGRPRNVTLDTIITVPANRKAVVEILGAERDAAGATNVDQATVGMHGVTNAIITPYLQTRPADILTEIVIQ